MTAYSCFRSGTRIFCDFDLSVQGNYQVNSSNGYNGVTVVDDGGKITGKHNAFFLFNDGTQGDTAYASTGTPLRYIVEYDDIATNYTSVSLVWGQQRIQGVPITAIDPSLPAGSIPGRGGAAAPGGQPAAAAGASSALNQGQAAATTVSNTVTQGQNTVQGATDQVNQTVNGVNQQVSKAKKWWQKVQANLPQSSQPAQSGQSSQSH